MKKNKYDSISVIACRKCLSLKVVEEETIFCAKCGNTTLIKCPDIFEWERLYKEMHGHKFIKDKKDGKTNK